MQFSLSMMVYHAVNTWYRKIIGSGNLKTQAISLATNYKSSDLRQGHCPLRREVTMFAKEKRDQWLLISNDNNSNFVFHDAWNVCGKLPHWLLWGKSSRFVLWAWGGRVTSWTKADTESKGSQFIGWRYFAQKLLHHRAKGYYLT